MILIQGQTVTLNSYNHTDEPVIILGPGDFENYDYDKDGLPRDWELVQSINGGDAFWIARRWLTEE